MRRSRTSTHSKREALDAYHVDYALVPPRYRSSYFAHIWGNGYSAGYYAYLWTAVLRDDAFYWFKEHGGMTRENGQRFRDMVLSRGNTEDTDALYRAFRGRDPSVEPLLIERWAQGGKAKAKKSKVRTSSKIKRWAGSETGPLFSFCAEVR